jgi:hypothetical protein
MLPLDIFLSAMANGLMMGAVYALVALGLTLVYGVLHIINFAHGATLTAAMYAVYVAHAALGVDPYLALPGLAAIFFALGYLVQRWVIGPASHGDDSNILLVTLDRCTHTNGTHSKVGGWQRCPDGSCCHWTLGHVLEGRQRVKIHTCRHLCLEELWRCAVALRRQGVPAHTKVSFNLTTAHHSPGHVLVDSIQTR